jgi:anti-sigma B factor antagonist
MATPGTQLVIDELASDPNGSVVLRVVGELDISTANALREAVGPRLAPGARIVLDLSGLAFCDSTGLSVLVGFHKRLVAGGGRLELYAPVPRVLHLLTITGLNRVFGIRAAGDEPTAVRPP